MFPSIILRRCHKLYKRSPFLLMFTMMLVILFIDFSWTGNLSTTYFLICKTTRIDTVRQSNSQFANSWCWLERWRVGWEDVLRPCQNRMSWEQRDVKSRTRTDASKSFISLWDLKPPGHFSRFWIQSVDLDGRKKLTGGDSWRVYIRQGPVSLAPVVIDHANGLYEVLVLVPEPGTYSAQVILDHSLCDGLREPPKGWFANGTDYGTYHNPKKGILGYIGGDYIMKKLMDNDHHNFTIVGKVNFPWKPHGHYTECPHRCNWLWESFGYWKNNNWFTYRPDNLIFGGGKVTARRPRMGTLWVYGDSLGYRFVESARVRRLCTAVFQRCNYTYNWIYEVKDKKRPLRVTTDFNKNIILSKLRDILELPEMTNPDSVLLLSFGIHFPISLTFDMYKELIDSAISLVLEKGKNGSPRYAATVIWKSTAAFERQKINRVPWPRRPLNFTMFRFLTTQRNQLFHAYALSAMCEAGIPVLDVYPLTAAFPAGTVDYVHYEDRVFFPAEQAIESLVTRKRLP